MKYIVDSVLAKDESIRQATSTYIDDINESIASKRPEIVTRRKCFHYAGNW